jgi:aminoglycoside 3-N-acetyltransferase I
MSTSAQCSYVRLAPADAPVLKTLLRVFGEVFDERETYGRAIPGDDYLARLLAKDAFIAIAALDRDEVVGGLAAYVLDKFEQDRREVYIYDLGVLETHRRRGIATGLIEALRLIAASIDAYVIFVQADLEDGPAIALYRSLGRQETAHHFDINVPSTPKSH